jgi:prevent-host-death family protein
MSSQYIGIEDARKKLGELVNATIGGADIILTRNGRPVARLATYQEPRVFTVEIQAPNANHTVWQALAPAETVTDYTNAADLARDTALNQNIADGDNWRVVVWEGEDTGIQPAYIHDGGPLLTIAELAQEIADPDATPERVARFVGAFIEYDPRTGRLPKPWYGKGMKARFTEAEADELVAEWARASRATAGFTDLLDGTEPIERAPGSAL